MTVENHQEIPKRIVDQFPSEASIDPVEAIVTLLTDAGHPEPRKWLSGLDPVALLPDANQQVKRFLVNRYWRPVLGMVAGEDTSVARYCMMDDGPMYTWLLLFSESVVPVIVKHQLPNLDW